MAYQAVIFDFDYTLADATPGIVASYHYALEKHGFAKPSTDAVRRTVGMTVVDSLTQLCGCTDPVLLEKMRVSFVEKADRIMCDNTRLYEQTPPLLTELHHKGIKTGIVSTKYRYRIEEVFRRNGLLACIDIIVGFEDLKNPKPAPDGLLLAIRTAGADTGSSLYAGDSLIDAETARAAGVDFAAVLTGTTTREDFAGYPRKKVLENIGGLRELIFER